MNLISETEVMTAIALRKSKRTGERFLKGPIPMSAIAAAAKLNGKALAIYLAAIHRRDITGATEITLPKSLLSEIGVGRDTKSKSLHDLESAGLIEVRRLAGRAATVKIRNIGVVDEHERQN